MTVKEFLEQHPNAIVCLKTGGGNVTVTPVQRNVLLFGGSIVGYPGCPGKEFEREITADELLPQIICVGSKGDEVCETWYLLSDFPEENSLPDTATDRDRLLTRLKDNYMEYQGELYLKTPFELMQQAGEISAIKRVYNQMCDHGWDDGYTSDLLKAEKPLMVIAEGWLNFNDVAIGEEFDRMLSLAAAYCSEEFDDPKPSM